MSQPYMPPASGVIRLVLPADPAFLTGLRVMAGTAAALSELCADDIEDMRMAVDEAATLLLPLVPSIDAELTATFTVAADHLQLSLSVPCCPGGHIDQHGLGWLMLMGLDPDVQVTTNAASMTIAIARGTPRA